MIKCHVSFMKDNKSNCGPPSINQKHALKIDMHSWEHSFIKQHNWRRMITGSTRFTHSKRCRSYGKIGIKQRHKKTHLLQAATTWHHHCGCFSLFPRMITIAIFKISSENVRMESNVSYKIRSKIMSYFFH